MHKQNGFTLIELMIVVAIIAIIAAIAIPNILRSRWTANEDAAIISLREIQTAEGQFHNVNSQYGTLNELGSAEPSYIKKGLASGEKQGYKFTITLDSGPKSSTFQATAVPIAQDNTGKKCYFIDESGVMTFTSNGTLPNAASKQVP